MAKKPYCAEHFFLLLFLGINKKSRQATKIAKTAAHWKVKAPKNNNLWRASHKLWAVYDLLHIKCTKQIRADMNKVHHTSSLNYQRTGLRKQYTMEWDPTCADKTVCPVCGCKGSMTATSPDVGAVVCLRTPTSSLTHVPFKSDSPTQHGRGGTSYSRFR